MLFFSVCSRAIQGAPRLAVTTRRPVISAPRHVVRTPNHVVGVPKYVVSAPRYCQDSCQHSQERERAQKVLSGAPRCFQSYPNYSQCTPVPGNSDSSDTEGQPEFSLMVCFSAENGSPKLTLHIPSESPGGFQ
jgi:hypothetical protein